MASAFTIAEVSRIAGISARQLAYWDTTGLVHPALMSASGKGTRRLYSIRDIVELKVVRRLLDGGLSLQRIRKSLDFIRSLPDPLTELVIVSDRETIYVCKSDDVIVDTLRHGQTVLTLVVGDLLSELEVQVSSMARERRQRLNEGAPISIGLQARR